MVQGGQISPFMRAMLTMSNDGEVEAPDNILQTVSAAYQQYVSVRNDSIQRIAEYSAIEGMIAGAPPYDQEELEANGLAHIANFNNFKARAAYERSAQGLWNLINSTEVYVKVILTGNYPDIQKYADIIARNFSDVSKEWEDFTPNFNLLGAQLTKFGLCPVIFPHEESPLWEVVDLSKFFVPSQSLSYLSKLSNVCVETVYTVQELYHLYESAGDSGPWNRDALAQFLILRANALTQNTVAPGWSIMELQRFIDNNDAVVNQYFTDTVRLVNMYQKEYSGKVSHYIFSADLFQSNVYGGARQGENPASKDTKDFLYFENEQYDSIEEAMLLFTSSPGEWTIHGNVGLGQKMFAMASGVNMLDCTVADMAKMSATPLIRTLATGGRDAAAIRFYPGVITDIGAAEFQPNTLGANIQQVVGAAQYLTQGLELNAINSGDNPAVPDATIGSLSEPQARAKTYKEFSVLKNFVAHFYNTFDKVVRLSFVRFLTVKEGEPGYELAKEFKRRCFEDGVPEVLLDTAKKGLHGLPRQFRSVKASRVAGDGSTLARIMGLEALAPIMGTFNAQEIAAYKREWVAATCGVDYIPTFASSEGQGDEVSGGASLARTEDNLMKGGFEPLFSADNDQAAHADEHMGTLTQVVQAVAQQQMSPVDADKIMGLGIPHITEHIQFMSKTPQFYRETLNALNKPYKQLVQWAQLNRRNAESMIQAAIKKQQEDQAATQEVMTEEQRKDFVAQADVARADRKVTAQNERAAEANETRAEILNKKTDADIETKRKKTDAEIAIKQSATPKGRTQLELAGRSPAELSSQLSGLLGSTPSTVDFEA